MRRWPRILFAGGVFLALACEGGERPRDAILITVDTLRSDRLGFAGHDRPTSPALDRLAAGALVFEDAYSGSGWTLPAMATVLTGRRPRTHEARHLTSKLRPDLATLPEILRQHGFETRGYVSHVLLSAHRGFARGFDVYDESVLAHGDPHRVTTAEALTDRVLGDLDRRPIRRPFFLWVHYFDPHYEYLVHPQWASFGVDPIDRYDGEIALVDREIGRLLEGLRERAIYDDAVVMLTADHGEEFGERGGRFHSTLHEEVTLVPLLIRGPGVEPGRSDAIARHIDVPTTLLSRLGIAPPADWPGRDLLAAPAEDPAVFFGRVVPSGFRQRAVRKGDYKLLVVEPREPGPLDADLPAHPGLVPGVFLYDLARDPAESRDLAPEQPERVRTLLGELRAHFGEPALGAPVGAPSTP